MTSHERDFVHLAACHQISGPSWVVKALGSEAFRTCVNLEIASVGELGRSDCVSVQLFNDSENSIEAHEIGSYWARTKCPGGWWERALF